MAVVVGTVIGSGVFKKPQEVAAHVPQFGLAALVWVLGGLLAFLGALALAEVAVLYPRAGGNYVYLREGYDRLAGFLWGWVEFWMIRGGSLAALATVFAESLRDVLHNPAFRAGLGLVPESEPLEFWEERGLTVAVLFLLALVNIRGVRWGGLLQLFITAVKVGSLLAIMALPFLAAALAGSAAAARPHADYLLPLWPGGWGEVNVGGFGVALLGVLFAYHGWMNVVPVAGEVRQPQRNLPLALLGGTAVVIFLYLGANLAYYLIIPQGEMAGLTKTPVVTVFCQQLLGPIGAAAASAAVMCSTFGALNGNLLVGPRVLYAMGEDRLAPPVLGEVHARYHTPAVAIAVMAGWSALLVLVAAALTRYRLPVLELGGAALDLNLPPDKPLFNILTTFAMFGAVVFETIAVATIFVFRARLPDAERPYRCWGYPWVPALYVGVMAFVVVNTFLEQTTEALIGVALIALGAVVYAAAGYGREAPKSLKVEVPDTES
jgi:amino acid transporter